MITIDEALLKKYFSNQCTAAEEMAVIEYLTAAAPDYTALRALFDGEEAHVQPAPMPRPMARSLTKALRTATVQQQAPGGKLLSLLPAGRRWYMAGAAAVLVPLLITAYRMVIHTPVHKATEQPATAQTGAGKQRRLYNSTNETRLAAMPDGSRIWLTAYSSITYNAAAYSSSLREITLEGEAFFDVRHDEAHPFVVRHGAIATQVLGTAFNIEAYADERAIRIALLRGKVAVKTAGAGLQSQPLQVLEPGQVLSYQKASGQMKLRSLLMKEESDYTKGYFVLNDIPLADALHRIERKYHTPILVPRTLKLDNMRVTAVFKSGTVAEILQNLLFIHGLHFRQQGDVIRIFQ